MSSLTSGSFCCRSLKNGVFRRQLIFTTTHAGPQQVHWICRILRQSISQLTICGSPSDSSTKTLHALPDQNHNVGPQHWTGTTVKSSDHTTIWQPQYIGYESDARKLTVELHQILENVLQQSVQQSTQHAQHHSKDSVFRQLNVLPTTRRIL